MKRASATALSMLIASLVSVAPPVQAATVLAAEGTGQPRGTVQTAFSGAFCTKNACRSVDNARSPFDVALGSRHIQAAIDATPGDIILMGYSLGAASVYDRMRIWAQDPATAPEYGRVTLIVTLGNPENKFGGSDRTNDYAGLPQVQPYPHLDVSMQYDSVSDRPTRRSLISSLNTSLARHFTYFEPVDVNDPENLIFRDADGTTYMLIRADVLPLLKWLDPWVSDAQMARLDAVVRPLVEKDYDRPDYIPQGEGADWGNGTPPPTVEKLDTVGSPGAANSYADLTERADPVAGRARDVKGSREDAAVPEFADSDGDDPEAVTEIDSDGVIEGDDATGDDAGTADFNDLDDTAGATPESETEQRDTADSTVTTA
ncbi:transcriptional regulator [Mycolicibacterium aurum]|uniref:Transcriptional regulator n=1 Tax=Mycolicibacterium aurum TaxID=1791 RepID=A0A3S4RS15_MYCAU|nr:PE-PPE domain-containing protein [Mycolicibacterium aurum]VEG50913.1 transcriptional regulator [Mycolicibacterium aurum]